MSKIPCSVGILTLNAEKTLSRCLESVEDFAEIIICDGNSTDRTRDIARQYGCKIIKQYNSDEPNLRCVKDKANVRNKNMNAATYDWYFWLDADDELSPEAVRQIRDIANSSEPQHLVWRIPMRIIIDGREIKYSSNYPIYQERLVNRKTGIEFIKPVHERLHIDKQKYSVGALQGYYNIHWSKKRVENFWQGTIKTYVQHEMREYKKASILQYIKSMWKRFKWSVRVVLFSLKNYLLHGFSHSMPLRVEAGRIWYHMAIAWRITKKQFFSSW